MSALIWLAVFFLVLALVSYILGAKEIAGFNMDIARWLVIIFVILAIIVFLFSPSPARSDPAASATPPIPTANITVIESSNDVYVEIHSDKPVTVLRITGGA
jgi:uncharacterized membrane protein YfcA